MERGSYSSTITPGNLSWPLILYNTSCEKQGYGELWDGTAGRSGTLMSHWGGQARQTSIVYFPMHVYTPIRISIP